MSMMITREVKGAHYTVTFDDGGATRANVSFYRGATRVAKGVWDGSDFAPSFANLCDEIDDSEDVYSALAIGVREHLAVIAGGGLAPWGGIAARLGALSTEAVEGFHVTLAALLLATARMSLDDVCERLNVAAKLETSVPTPGSWSAAERKILGAAVAALRSRIGRN